MTVSKNINTKKKTIGMINNIKSQLFQCKCFVCVSQSFLTSEVQTKPICVFKREKKQKEKEERGKKGKHARSCCVPPTTGGVGEKLEPPCKS